MDHRGCKHTKRKGYSKHMQKITVLAKHEKKIFCWTAQQRARRLNGDPVGRMLTKKDTINLSFGTTGFQRKSLRLKNIILVRGDNIYLMWHVRNRVSKVGRPLFEPRSNKFKKVFEIFKSVEKRLSISKISFLSRLAFN
jgi:hypothetical protein